jgi:hypothetical protein
MGGEGMGSNPSCPFFLPPGAGRVRHVPPAYVAVRSIVPQWPSERHAVAYSGQILRHTLLHAAPNCTDHRQHLSGLMFQDLRGRSWGLRT